MGFGKRPPSLFTDKEPTGLESVMVRLVAQVIRAEKKPGLVIGVLAGVTCLALAAAHIRNSGEEPLVADPTHEAAPDVQTGWTTWSNRLENSIHQDNKKKKKKDNEDN
jgi:hypothetical protein